MKVIYFFVNLKDELGVYKDYFETNGGFWEALGIAALVALVFAVLFYLVIGFLSHDLSRTRYWWVTMLVAMICSFTFTCANTSMSNPHRGLGETLEKRWAKIDFDQEKKPAYDMMKRDFKKGIAKVKPVRNLCIGNCIYTAILFYLFSLVFLFILPERNLCKEIPHRLG